MWFGRIGGALVVAGATLCMLAVVIGLAGGEVRWAEACWQWDGCDRYAGGGDSVLHLITPASLTLIGIGAALLGLAGPRPFDGRLSRVGPGMTAIGLLSYVAATNMSIPAGTNTAQSLPIVVGLLVGLVATILGLVVTGLALLRRPGSSRVVGALLLAGLALLPVSLIVMLGVTGTNDEATQAVLKALLVVGSMAIFASGIGVGVIVFYGASGSSTSAAELMQ
jgi:hypothetical protein